MLILGRSLNECVVVDTPLGRLVVKVTHIQHGQVKLGFEGSSAFVIHRSEVRERIDAERAAAGKA